MLQLLLELLRSDDLPDLATTGAWCTLAFCLVGRPAVARVAVQADLLGLAAAHLRAIGPASDWVVSVPSTLLVRRHLR